MDQPKKQTSIFDAYKALPILSFRKMDIFVVIMAVVLGVLTPLAIRIALNSKDIATYNEPKAILTVAGEQIWQQTLIAEEQDEELFVFDDNGYSIVVGYDGVSVWFESSNCPDQTCVKMGRVAQSGQIAICVPNRAMLSVVSGQSLDAALVDAETQDGPPDMVSGRIGG